MSVYPIRVEAGKLSGSTGDSHDALFVDQRFEGQELRGISFRQCAFANISFKGTRLIDCHFSARVFEGCYFCGTKLKECRSPLALNCVRVYEGTRICLWVRDDASHPTCTSGN